MLVDVELRHERIEWSIPRTGIVAEIDGVLVHGILTPGCYTAGLTELDALANFRHSTAFLCDTKPADVELRVW